MEGGRRVFEEQDGQLKVVKPGDSGRSLSRPATASILLRGDGPEGRSSKVTSRERGEESRSLTGRCRDGQDVLHVGVHSAVHAVPVPE